ncbi:GNAT family N-acetyltransferase [Pseudooceanicola sp. CBS1P-1]|uniref:GNAT family N-acetyltransferase n=1 Tax=Pseudooceanicola albus TaxID=2692189 RepID=A0A6L7G7R3_9RHOB|nr:MULTISPECIES: GNAT family N-acetyltransferase [Pseudooceanicola]MBT9386126.1 GNAT family N-acetyltransferase [Pseudooceanicola endophyticus]MXN19456.1 GNAT family N-acetyltransferase [Pseudooceanicola albus]
MLPKARLIDPRTLRVPREVPTPRLQLRAPSPAMALDLAEARAESHAALHPWFHAEMGTEAEEADPGWQAGRLAAQVIAFERREDLTYYLFDKGRLIGMITLHPLWRRGQIKLTYWIRISAQRQGYGREAVGAMVAFSFEVLSARLVTTGHAEPNRGSARLARSLGFRQIARQPLACELPDGSLVAGIGYALESDDRPPAAADGSQ